jgi:phosphoesterase RecJ-like protein
MGAMLSRMSLHHGNRVAVLRLDDALLKENGATVDDTEGLVNVPLGAREIAAVALIKQQADNVFRVSLRSKGTVDVRLVAARWDGGGHHNAAGCTMSGTFDEVREALVAALGEALSVGAAAS